MIPVLLSLMLAHHADGTSWGWHMSCERFMERSAEISMDTRLDYRSRMNLIAYLRTKVNEPCSELMAYTPAEIFPALILPLF